MTDMSQGALHLDFETRSACDLSKTGVYRYAEDPSTWIWCFAWRFENCALELWKPNDPEPVGLLDHVAQGGRLVAHNAGFERTIWNTTLRKRYPHWPELRIEQVDCTMARALAVHLPAGLDELSKVLGLKENKDKEGAALMRKMCKPRKIHDDGTMAWWDDPGYVDRLGTYCMQDVEVESLCNTRLPPLSADERALWELDQKINDRGVAIDVETVKRAVQVLDVAQERADVKMRLLTNNYVERCTNAVKLVEWLVSRGISCESIAKGTHEELKATADIMGDETARQVIELRAEAGRSSTAKYKRMLESVCADGRVRGLHSYHRGHTGRWGGAGVQAQNLPRVEDENGNYLSDVLTSILIMERFAL